MSGYVMAGAMIASTAAGMYQNKRTGDRADAEGRRQAEAAEKARQQQEQDFNKENRNTADVSGLLQNNAGAGSAGLVSGGYLPGQLGGGGMLGR